MRSSWRQAGYNQVAPLPNLYTTFNHCCAGISSAYFQKQLSQHANAFDRYILLKLVVSLSNRPEA
jgi:hypothetical protein